MEEQWIADRAALRALLRMHPDWTQSQLAQHLGRSVSWVKHWRRRLRAAAPDDPSVLWSRSRARHTPPPATHPFVVERVLALRDELPATLHRTPGSRALQYYLARDPELRARGLTPPRSTRTLWRILRRYGRIVPRVPRRTDPVDRPPPLTAWQLDFKDASTVPADPDGKRQHVVEVLNTRLSPHAVTSQQRNPARVAPSVYDMGNDQQLRPASTLELSGPFNTLVPPHA